MNFEKSITETMRHDKDPGHLSQVQGHKWDSNLLNYHVTVVLVSTLKLNNRPWIY